MIVVLSLTTLLLKNLVDQRAGFLFRAGRIASELQSPQEVQLLFRWEIADELEQTVAERFVFICD
jgi:hypothetical protein